MGLTRNYPHTKNESLLSSMNPGKTKYQTEIHTFQIAESCLYVTRLKTMSYPLPESASQAPFSKINTIIHERARKLMVFFVVQIPPSILFQLVAILLAV